MSDTEEQYKQTIAQQRAAATRVTLRPGGSGPPNSRHLGIESHVPWDVIHDDLPRVRTEDDTTVGAAQAATEQGEE